MCQYCIEGGILIPMLESVYMGEITKIEGLNISSYIKEGENLYVAVDKAKGFEDYCSIDIIICRLYEEYIFHGFNNLPYKKITAVFGSDVVDIFLKQRNALNKKQKISVIWENLYNREIYQNNRQWNNFMSAKTELKEISFVILNFYYDWWIKGHKKVTSNPMKKLKKTGILNPIGNTPQKKWDSFCALFPWVYFSLVYLYKYHNDTELIEKIALHSPNGVPGMEGDELWLQRKAFIFFIQKVGIINALAKIDEIRVQLIYYALLKCKVSEDEIKIIVELLRENPDRFGLGDEVDYYISQIEDVIISTLPY
jgi:hypothetical protein